SFLARKLTGCLYILLLCSGAFHPSFSPTESTLVPSNRPWGPLAPAKKRLQSPRNLPILRGCRNRPGARRKSSRIIHSGVPYASNRFRGWLESLARPGVAKPQDFPETTGFPAAQTLSTATRRPGKPHGSECDAAGRASGFCRHGRDQ